VFGGVAAADQHHARATGGQLSELRGHLDSEAALGAEEDDQQRLAQKLLKLPLAAFDVWQDELRGRLPRGGAARGGPPFDPGLTNRRASATTAVPWNCLPDVV
jgi:hypothetical protein